MASLFDRFMNKQAGDAVLSYAMQGKLYASSTGWLLLSVPNALVRGVFDSLSEPGVELPPSGPNEDRLNAHISVMRASEVESIGGLDKISERGHAFHYTLGPLRTCVPDGWSEMSKVWFIEVRSPELERLRKSYGLSALPNGGKYAFHISVAVRRKHVLRENEVSKAAAPVSPILKPPAKNKIYYHGSPDSGLNELSAGSYITPDLDTAKLMGRYHLETGDTWSDGDLLTPHHFGQEPKWKPGREPGGAATVYQVEVPEDATDLLDLLDNPYEHKTKRVLPVSRYTESSKNSPVLAKLRSAYEANQKNDYATKTQLLREMMVASPEDFCIDSDQGYTVGITHQNTGFRFHLPVATIADIKSRIPAQCHKQSFQASALGG